MKSLLEQKLIQKTLDAKFSLSDVIDHAIDNASPEQLVKTGGKNVCVFLAKPLLDRLESTIGLLSMSKSSFFELAIIDALDKASSVIHEYELLEALDSQPALKLKRVNPLQEVTNA